MMRWPHCTYPRHMRWHCLNLLGNTTLLGNRFVWPMSTPPDNNIPLYMSQNMQTMSIQLLNHTFLLDNFSDTRLLTQLYPHSNLH